MKNIKRITFFLLMMLCIGLPCETYQGYLDQFNNLTETTFYCPESIKFNTMISDISAKAKEHDIMIFKVRTQIHTLFSSEIDIYAEYDIIQYLQDEYHIRSGVFDSIVSGETQVNYHGFSEIPDELVVAEPEFQLIGDMENMRSFKSELIDTYAGSFPHDSGYDSSRDSKTLVLTMWVISIILTCFFTFYETMLMKRENFIRITMGESLFAIWVKYILTDLIYILACFSVCSFIIYQFYGVLFMFRYALLMLGILVVLNILVSANMFIYKKNKVLSNAAISSKALILNKLIRCITIVLTSACISTSLSVVYESYRFYQQKSFYDIYSDYVVLQNLKVETGGETFEYEGEFYKKYVKELEIFFLCERMALSSGKMAAIANHNTMDYIKSAIPELKNVVFDKDVYIIHKDSELINSMDMEFLKPTIDCEVGEVTYHENAELVSIELNYDNQFTQWSENPIIVYYNTDVAMLYDESMISMTVPIVLCLIKNDVVIDEFMRSNHISYSCTNMMDIFEQQWIKLKRTSYLSCILLVLLFVLQILVILNIVNLEYKVNAIELSIKKIIGFSMAERFRSQYVVSLLLYVFSLAVSLIVAGILKFGSLPFITYGIVLSYLIETVIFTLFAARYDRKNVQKILKGGAI